MSDVTNKLIVWGVIVVLSIIIAFICYRSQFCENLLEQIQFTELDTQGSSVKLDIAPFLEPFSKVLTNIPSKWINILIIVIPCIISFFIVLFVAHIILNIREPKKKEGEEDNRKHLFEYKSEILSKLNKNSER